MTKFTIARGSQADLDALEGALLQGLTVAPKDARPLHIALNRALTAAHALSYSVENVRQVADALAKRAALVAKAAESSAWEVPAGISYADEMGDALKKLATDRETLRDAVALVNAFFEEV